jgi:anti-sigma B factor antagonist
LRAEAATLRGTVQNTFEVEIRSQDHAAVIVVSGELDLASAPALEEQLGRAGQLDVTLVIVDLRALQFIDSTGLGILIKAHREAEGHGRRFAIVKGPSQVQRLLELTGLEERLTVVDSPEQLLEPGKD